MPKNHAKAIKGMSIACIAIAGVLILLCLAGLAFFSIFGPIIEEAILDSYAYDYGYGYGYDYDSIFGAYGLIASLDPVHGMHDHIASSYSPYAYSELGEFQATLSLVNVLLVLSLIAECLELAIGIIVLKNHNKPEKFGMVFAWSIVGAIVGIFFGSIATCVLLAITAVFVNSDKKLYQSGMYYMTVPGVPGTVAAYVPQQPVPPVVPSAPAPAQPVVQPVQTVPVAGVPSQPANQPMAQVATAEVLQPGAESAMGTAETQPPAPAGTEADAANAIAIAESAVVTEGIPVEKAGISAEPAPVVVDEGAVIKLDVSDEQASEK